MGNDCCSKGAGSNCQGGSCGSDKDCKCQCHACDCCGPGMNKDKMMFMMFMEMADVAWMKMVKQKMIGVWEKKLGHDMEKSAEFFVEQSMMKWMNEEEWKTNSMPKAMESFTKMMEEKKAKK